MLKHVGKFAVVALLAAAGAGCAFKSGRDFVKPIDATLVMGKTTESDVLKLYGKPEKEATHVSSGDEAQPNQGTPSEFAGVIVAGAYHSVTYEYMERQPPMAGGGIAVRDVNFVFLDGVLVSYNFVSNFPNDSSNFDETKFASLQKGKTTEPEMTALLGAPTGRAIYPGVRTRGNYKLIYSYVTYDPGVRKISNKVLVGLFGADGRLIDYQFNGGTSDAPAPQQGGGGYAPVFIPLPHK